ncbi:MAG: hypothetical protein AB1625_06765 [Acidobacteriota bacterium]
MTRTRLSVGLLLLVSASVATAQTGSEVVVGFAWLSTEGSRDSFASQFKLDDGIYLERLHLDFGGRAGSGFDCAEFTASGFGAEPSSHASLEMDWDRTWSIRLEYSRRESAFHLVGFDLGGRRDDWTVTRWAASLSYDNWKPARLRLDLRDVRRSGTTGVPFYGLGEPYVAEFDLNERVQEVGLSLETRSLPVKILIGQDLARYVRDSRGRPGNGGQPAGGADPDELVDYTTPGKSESDVPTTRLAAVYESERFQLAATGLYRRDRLDTIHDDRESYDLSGGAVGGVTFVDRLVGGADVEQRLGHIRLGFAPAKGLTLRVRGRWEESTQDGSAVGERLLRVAGNGGSFEISDPIDDQTAFERTDEEAAAEVEWQRGPVALTVDYHEGSREVAYRRETESPPEAVARDLSGWGATASVAFSRALSFDAGVRTGNFEKYVFRTEPESVRRTWGRLRARASDRLEFTAYASREAADNPADVADLDRSVDGTGISVVYSTDGGAFVVAGFDALSIDSRTELRFFAPGRAIDTSRYSSRLMVPYVRFAAPIGAGFKISGGALRVGDDGESSPFVSQQADLRVEVDGPFDLDWAVFANYWKYDQDGATADDFTVARYGVAIGRRF